MVFINGVKYACERCIRGHRVSACLHVDQPLMKIKPKGRPKLQCNHCRDLRKKGVHNACLCGAAAAGGSHANNCPCNTGQPCTCSSKKKKLALAEPLPGTPLVDLPLSATLLIASNMDRLILEQGDALGGESIRNARPAGSSTQANVGAVNLLWQDFAGTAPSLDEVFNDIPFPFHTTGGLFDTSGLFPLEPLVGSSQRPDDAVQGSTPTASPRTGDMFDLRLERDEDRSPSLLSPESKDQQDHARLPPNSLFINAIYNQLRLPDSSLLPAPPQPRHHSATHLRSHPHALGFLPYPPRRTPSMLSLALLTRLDLTPPGVFSSTDLLALTRLPLQPTYTTNTLVPGSDEMADPPVVPSSYRGYTEDFAADSFAAADEPLEPFGGLESLDLPYVHSNGLSELTYPQSEDLLTGMTGQAASATSPSTNGRP